MTGMKRLLTLTGLIVAVVIGSSIPASAGFADSVAVATTSYATATIAPPTSVTGKLTCGSTSSTMNVTWAASTSSRISGYRITVHFSDGYEQSESVSATTTSWTKSTSTYNVTKYAIRYSVTTLTDYGWFKQSTLTGWFQC